MLDTILVKNAEEFYSPSQVRLGDYGIKIELSHLIRIWILTLPINARLEFERQNQKTKTIHIRILIKLGHFQLNIDQFLSHIVQILINQSKILII